MSVETKELKYHSVGHAIVSSYYRGEEYVISEMNTIIAIMDGVKKYQKGEMEMLDKKYKFLQSLPKKYAKFNSSLFCNRNYIYFSNIYVTVISVGA